MESIGCDEMTMFSRAVLGCPDRPYKVLIKGRWEPATCFWHLLLHRKTFFFFYFLMRVMIFETSQIPPFNAHTLSRSLGDGR